MSFTSYKYEKDGWGSLELDIADSNRSFYQAPDIEKIKFSTNGLDSPQSNNIPFHFYEWQTVQYSYIIENVIGFHPPFEIRINNRTLKKSKERSNYHLLTGQFSFENQVGETTIEIRDFSNKLIFELCTEVFPQKMDYKSDYKSMMTEITSIIQNLAFDTLKDTFRRSKARLSGVSTENEWWSIIDSLFNQIIINLGVIKRQPKHEIRTYEKVQYVEKIKDNTRKNIDWFKKNSRYSNCNGIGIKITHDKFYSHALSSKKYVTYDTYENRFIVWAVKKIIEQLRQYRKRIELISKKSDFSPLIERIKLYQSSLQTVMHEPPFNEVGEFEKRNQFSTSLTRGAGYRDFMHIYLLLTRGLELADNEIFKIEQKDISTLYEYWCFLAIVNIAREEMNLKITYNDVVKIKSSRIKVELQKGNPSEIRFSNEEIGEQLSIYFNKEFVRDEKKIFTYRQIPDIAIKFTKNGYLKPFWYVFDAKYRFEEKNEYSDTIESQKYNVPQDAIGQLHRYRDAILHTVPAESSYRSAIKNLGGIILYPYPKSEKEFLSNTFYKSIDQVNIGALPFLPSKSGLVIALLNKLINKTLPEEHFEQFIEMDNSEYQRQRNSWLEWVTIAGVQKEYQNERLDFISSKNIFHVPFVKYLNSKIYLSKNILICKAGTKEAVLYSITNWEILSEKELQQMGTSWPHRTNKYIAFHIKKEKELRTPDKLTPLKYRFSTMEGLSRYIENPVADKACFYLTNPDAARLYLELKHEKIDFTINWVENTNDQSLIKFIIHQLDVFSSDKFPDLYYKYENERVSLKTLLIKIKNKIKH